MNLADEIVEMIASGDITDMSDLLKIKTAVAEMIEGLADTRIFRRGALVKVTSPDVRPKYLIGGVFSIVKVNTKTVVLSIPNNPRYRRYAGASEVRFPKSAVTPLEG